MSAELSLLLSHFEVEKAGVKMGTMLMVHDLQKGEDGFTGAKLPKIDLPNICWAQLSMSIESALLDCAKNHAK